MPDGVRSGTIWGEEEAGELGSRQQTAGGRRNGFRLSCRLPPLKLFTPDAERVRHAVDVVEPGGDKRDL